MLYVQSIIVLSVWEHAVRTVHVFGVWEHAVRTVHVFGVWVNGVEISAKVHTSPCVQYLEACQ